MTKGSMIFLALLVLLGVFVALVMIDPAAQFQQHVFRSRVTYAPAGSSSK